MNNNYADLEENNTEHRGITINSQFNHEDVANMIFSYFTEAQIKEMANTQNIAVEELKTRMVELYLKVHEEAYEDSKKDKIILQSLMSEMEYCKIQEIQNPQSNSFIESKMTRGKNPWDKKKR